MMAIILIPIFFILIIIYVLSTYNKFVKMRNRVENQSSQIDVELKRRFDLIPNLVETVKGAAQHEKSVLEDVIKARSNYLAAGDNTDAALEADSLLNNALSRLFALMENYPEIRANENFQSLQSELSNIEQKIVYARQFYNDAVLKLNDKIDLFPSNIVAAMWNFKKESYFEAKESERENAQVKF